MASKGKGKLFTYRAKKPNRFKLVNVGKDGKIEVQNVASMSHIPKYDSSKNEEQSELQNVVVGDFEHTMMHIENPDLDPNHKRIEAWRSLRESSLKGIKFIIMNFIRKYCKLKGIFV